MTIILFWDLIAFHNRKNENGCFNYREKNFELLGYNLNI
jgi:hypothetical protein